VMTSFGGLPPKNGCSLLNPSTMSWFVTMTVFFRGRVFGRLRFLLGWLSLFG
jgi:hypothetical protein